MPVTKAVMANGSFSVDLARATPTSVTDAADIATKAFSTLIVTPTWLDPSWCSATSIRAQSVFTGVLFGREERTKLTGYHATAWANDPGGIGEITERLSSSTNANFFQWFTFEIPGALTQGAIDNYVPTLTWDPQYITIRQWWDFVLDYFRDATGNSSIEWRVTDQLALDAGTVASLYTENAAAMLTDDFAGWDPVLPGLNATLSVADDAEDYTSRLLFFPDTGGVAASGTNPYVDWDGNAVVRKAKENDSSVPSAAAAGVARSRVALVDQSRRKLTATTDSYCVLKDVQCGQYVHCWDQEQGIVDLAQKVEWRGTIANPVLTRVVGVTMPLEMGMGVYLVNGGGTPIVTDLTPWVEWESPGARFDLGALDRNYAYGVRSRAG